MRIVFAIMIGLGIAIIGVWVFRVVASARPPDEQEPEDVADLDVYFVCGECGTEFRVERIGELQVPRHCGEPMRVERRPSAGHEAPG